MAPEKNKKKTKATSKDRRPGSPGSRPCSSACGFFFSEANIHEACPMCLGMLNAKAALTDPDVCLQFSRLRHTAREKRVEFLTKTLGNSNAVKDPLLTKAKTSYH